MSLTLFFFLSSYKGHSHFRFLRMSKNLTMWNGIDLFVWVNRNPNGKYNLYKWIGNVISINLNESWCNLPGIEDRINYIILIN